MAIRQLSQAVLFALGTAFFSANAPAADSTSSYIVEAHGNASAVAAVRTAGGSITHELPIINAVAALLTAAQAGALRENAALSLFADAPVVLQQGENPVDRYASTEIAADQLASQGFSGSGVTIAILDSGTSDATGHGSYVAGIIGQPQGIAPDAHLVAVKAFDRDGNGTYSTVLDGLSWIQANLATYNIRVLNLSFGAQPQSAYSNDPINQAVTQLWQAGVVVIGSAGDEAAGPMATTVPGNNPDLISVGAMTDDYGPVSRSAAEPSSPTTGRRGPDVVAPAGAAAVSGVAALMLQANPSLTPEALKSRLIASATSLPNSNSSGGLVNAYEAVHGTAGAGSPTAEPVRAVTPRDHGYPWTNVDPAPPASDKAALRGHRGPGSVRTVTPRDHGYPWKDTDPVTTTPVTGS